MRTRTVILALTLALALGLAACGGGDGETADETTTVETTTEGDSVAVGRTIFVESCGPCHTLSDAGTTGATGPVLDGTSLAQEQIAEQVRSGGGGMPAFEGDLSEDEIAAVSAYVAEAARG